MRQPIRIISVLALFAACSSDPLPFSPAGPDAAPEPSKPGPFPVGVRTLELEDPARSGKAGRRRLVTEVWYPAAEDSRGQPGDTYDLSVLLTAEQRAEVGELSQIHLATDAVRDAPVRRSRGPYPVVLFSHGQGSVRWQSTFLTVLLASHGYVVIAPDHEGHTLADALRDELVDMMAGVEDRPRDILFLLDWMEEIEADHFLAGMMDLARIGMVGHSFGGFTTLRTAALDPRIRVISPQTPPSAEMAFIGLPRPVDLGIPALVVAGRADVTTSWEEHTIPTWNALQKPRFLLDLPRAGHFTFSDLCAFDLATLAKRIGFDDLVEVLEDGCGPNALSTEDTFTLTNHFTVALFNAVLRDSPGSWPFLTQEHADRLVPGEAAFTAER